VAAKCPQCHFENPDNTLFCGRCGTKFPSPEDISVSHTETLETPKKELTTGSAFAGRYQIIEELGKGGMGKVYRVVDKKLNEEVALKLIKPEIASDKKTLERFSNELKIARKIVHKNVGRMYHLAEEKGTHYITMEYVPGEDLKSFIRRSGQLAVGTTIRIAKQVCDGLTEAHKLGVIHRDLKPQNIMIDKEGNARIMDFGIARSLKAKGITGAGVMIGTPEYMSPEQVEGKEADQRSDIYSLGVILYEMVTGRVPFEGDTPFTIGVKHKSEIPKDPKELNTQIPEDLSRMIIKCLEKNKEKRYQTAGEVLTELTRIEKGIPTTERVVPKRKPLTSREITVTFGLKKLFIPALVVIALLIGGVIIWQILPQKEAVSISSGKPSLAIMYFKNNTGDESLDHWRTMLSNLLTADLTQSKHIRVLSEDKLFNILKQLNQVDAKTYSSEILKKVAAQGGVNHILQGAYAKAGDKFRINVMLQEASTGELIGSESVAGKGEKSIFSMVDELTRKIKANFKLSSEEITSDIDREIAKITTAFPEAYKYYIKARKYHDAGEDRKAIQFYEKAIAIDSEFAMAYRGMATAYNNLGYVSDGRKNTQKALELSDRLSDRERYLIQAQFYWRSEKTYDKSIEAFNKLLELYPKDRTGNTNLGIVYTHLEEWDKAIERYEVLIQAKDDKYFPYVNISEPYMAKGMYDKARKVLEYYLHNFPDNANIHWSLATVYLCQGKYDLALIEVDKALSLFPNHTFIMTKGNVYHCRGDFNKAEKEYQKLLKSEEKADHLYGKSRLGTLYLSQGMFRKSKDQFRQGIELAEKMGQVGWESRVHLYLAYLHLKSGSPQEALKEGEEARRIAVGIESLFWQRESLFIKGFAYLEMKSLIEAQKVAEELDRLIQEGMNMKLMRFHHLLIGKIELKKGNFSRAIENLKSALSLMPNQFSEFFDRHALFLGPLASAYYKSGDLEKAAEEYERIISLTTGRLAYGDIYAESFYMLGKIYEQKGWKDKAIEHYEKFLDLWKDADPDIPEVKDARKIFHDLLFDQEKSG